MASDIQVGPLRITEEQVLREMQYHPAASIEEARHEAARALVVRSLLLLKARGLGLIAESPELDRSEREVQAAIQRVTEQEVPVQAVADEQCRVYYEENPDRFRGPELFDPSHILFPTGAADDTQRQVLRAKAQSVLESLLLRPEDFERKARELSACPSGSNGGQLGQVTLGETDKTFEAAFVGLEPGALSGELVETRHGFHIIKLNQKASGAVLPFHAVRDKVRIYLRDAAWRQQFRDYVLEISEELGVSGFDLRAVAPEPGTLAAPPETDSKPVRRLRVL